MGSPFGVVGSRPLAASTVTGLGTKAVAEGDGVLQMLLWLDRSPESFVRGGVKPGTDEPLPRPDRQHVLRFDTRAIHAALDIRRAERETTWADVSSMIRGTSANSLRHLATGGRTGFPHVVRITQWLDQPVAHFVRFTRR